MKTNMTGADPSLDAEVTQEKSFESTRERGESDASVPAAESEVVGSDVFYGVLHQGKRSGRWSLEEKILFLHGLLLYGKGKWKKIQFFVPSR
jgi:hypothetical protein